MSNSPYGPKDVLRVSFRYLPKAVQEAGISMIERKPASVTITDLMSIPDTDWHQAYRRFNAIQTLVAHPGRFGRRGRGSAKTFGATDRTVRRGHSAFRKNPDIIAPLPRHKGQQLGNRRLKPDSERLLGDVIVV